MSVLETGRNGTDGVDLDLSGWISKILKNHEINLNGGDEMLTKLLRLSDSLMRLWDIRPIWIFYRAHCELVRHTKKLLQTSNE